MSISILASLTGLGADRAVMNTAIAAAKIDGGHITCLHARIDVVETAAFLEVTFPQRHHGADLVRQISQKEAERGQQARAAFDEAVKHHDIPQREQPDGDAPVTACWRETKSFFNETLEEARYHDITVMARDPALSSEGVKSVLMQSGRPLLLASPKALPTMGRRIALAWKNGPEAARAVTAASPWLAGAQKVLIVTVTGNEAGDDTDRLSAERLAAALRWRGIRAEIEIAHSVATSDTQLLQNKVYDWDADLLVMGAYGHSRLRQFVLGGVTEDMLKGCAVPLLIFR
jgi:nucleotide-binding universal stress UspA family protein